MSEVNSIEYARNLHVIKSNDLVLKTRYSLSAQESKILLFIMTKINRTDQQLVECSFTIKEFADVCGYQKGGRQYKLIKASIKNLADKASLWMNIDGKGHEKLIRWITEADINNGIITLLLNDTLSPFLLNLSRYYLDYRFINILGMSSQYGIRLYELLMAKFNLMTTKKTKFSLSVMIRYEIDDLKDRLDCKNYKNFAHFKMYVLEPAKKDINECSDLVVSYNDERQGRKVKYVIFTVKLKSQLYFNKIYQNVTEKLNNNT